MNILKLLRTGKIKLEFTKRNLVLFVALFAFVGASILLISKAATPTANLEPENGTVNQNASVITDATASGGKYVKFGNGSGLTKLLTSQYRTGTTWTQDTFNSANSTALASGKALLADSTYYYNVHIMGFGPGNPSP